MSPTLTRKYILGAISTKLPRFAFWYWGGLNSAMGYARLRPRAYNLALRLRPGTKKLFEGAK